MKSLYKNAIRALANDQIFRAFLIFIPFLFGAFAFLSIAVSVINAQSIWTVITFFISEIKFCLLPCIFALAAIIRAVYFLICYLCSHESDARILRILTTSNWSEIDMESINKSYEILKDIERKTDKRVSKSYKRYRNIAAIEFEYYTNGENCKRKQFFWLLSPEQLLKKLSENRIAIIISRVSKKIAFVK
jgi:hypothetical protein